MNRLAFLCVSLISIVGAPARAGVSGPLASAAQNWWACEIRSQKPSGLYACSGVLVDPHTILTAKHCLTGEPINVMSVWCGGSWVNGQTSWNFPDSSDALDSDIALVTVSQDFWYSQQYAPKLPDSTKTSDEILKGGNCTTWGFGDGPDGQKEYLRWQRVADGSAPPFPTVARASRTRLRRRSRLP